MSEQRVSNEMNEIFKIEGVEIPESHWVDGGLETIMPDKVFQDKLGNAMAPTGCELRILSTIGQRSLQIVGASGMDIRIPITDEQAMEILSNTKCLTAMEMKDGTWYSSMGGDDVPVARILSGFVSRK